MTLIIGIRCQEGVVMASDSAATFGHEGGKTIGQQEVTKVQILNHSMLFSATGAVGIAQLISDRIEDQHKKKAYGELKTPPKMMGQVSRDIAAVVNPYLQSAQLLGRVTGKVDTMLCKTLIAIPVNQRPELFQFGFGGEPEHASPQLPFVALGSGQNTADPFLAFVKRLLWADTEPTLSEGRLVAAWAIDYTARNSPGDVGGSCQLGIISTKGLKPELLTADDIGEHRQKIEDAEKALVAALKGTLDTSKLPGSPEAPDPDPRS